MAFDIAITVEDGVVRETLDAIQRRLHDMRPAMRIIGETVRTSIVRNFEAGGRPTPWEKSKRGGQTLVDTARLKNSLTVAAGDDAVAVGTNVVYAPTHHFGAKQGAFGTVAAQIKAHFRRAPNGKRYQVKAHTRQMTLPWGDIPARPFLLVQDEDWPAILSQLSDFLMGEA